MKQSHKKNIAIIGVGLIGGSFALRLHEKKLAAQIFGVEPAPEHARQALELELVDHICTLDTAIREAEVLILTIPVNNICDMLPGIMNKIRPDQIVLDAGSTKASIIDSIRDHPKRKRFVATHPMWGTEYSGPSAAVPHAFQSKSVVLCDKEDSDPDAIEWVEYMYTKIGMRLLAMSAQEHDLHTAYISHISHITSFALANTVLAKEQQANTIFELASSGFESTVRLAKSNPGMWLPILQQNKVNIIEVLEEHITQLNAFKRAIEAEQTEELLQLILRANQIKKILK